MRVLWMLKIETIWYPSLVSDTRELHPFPTFRMKCTGNKLISDLDPRADPSGETFPVHDLFY